MKKHDGDMFLPPQDKLFNNIKDMYSLGPRRAGTKADHDCEDYLANALRTLGFENVRKDPIPMQVWQSDSYRLSVSDEGSNNFKEVTSFPIPFTKFTPDDSVEGRLLFVEPMDLTKRVFKKWNGRIIVAEIRFPKLSTDQLGKLSLGIHDPGDTLNGHSRFASWVRMYWSIYREAARRGAAGFIGILADHYVGGHKYYAPYGLPEKDIHDKPIPGFWVDRVTGARIREVATKESAKARMLLTGTLEPGVTHNVIGELPGESDDVFIIASHHDAPFRSAVEDASGCAVVLGAAEHFATARELKHKLIVMFTAGHFYGSIGTRTFIDRNKGALLEKVALEFHVEHIAREAVEKADGTLETLDRPDFIGAFVPFNRSVKRALFDAIVNNGLERTMLLPAHGPLGEYPPTDGGDFHLHGVPIVNFISPPLYLLNEEDTLDKVAVERLVPTAKTVIQTLRTLDEKPMYHLRRVDYPVRAGLMHALTRIVEIRKLLMGI